MEKSNEPKCEACGKPKWAHNILTQVASPPGTVRNGPYADANGQIFCHGYRGVR